MKKIIIIIPALGQGGAEKQSVVLAKQFHERGYNVELCCYSNASFFESTLKESGIKVNWLISNGLKRVFLFRHFIRASKCDAVISLLNTPNFLNDFSALGGKTWKVIGSIRGANMSYFKGNKARFYNWFHRYTDFIVSNSYTANEMCLHYIPQYNNKLKVIYNSVVIPKITTEYIMRNNGKTHFIIAASYSGRKNPFIIIDALKLMTDEERGRITIDWYGNKGETGSPDSVFNKLEKIICDYGFSDTFILHDAVANISDLMNTSDVVALVSNIEGLPNTIIEGMMIGKPVLMTNVSDYEYIVDESNGFICKKDDAFSVKDALLTASKISSKDLERMGQSSKKKAKRLFSMDNTINQWINLIES